MTATVDLPRVTAFRLELMNDPNLPAYGPGRSLWGTCALTEFEVEAGSKDRKKVKLAGASADFEEPETPLEAYYDDRSGKKRVVGPVAYAVDGKVETAWGSDVGPGRRNVPHEAVFVAEKPVESVDGKLELTFALVQNHGGWNSDDLMTQQPGPVPPLRDRRPRRRRRPRPAPDPRGPGRPRDRRSPEQVDAIFGYWRTTVPGWKAENDRIEALWRSHPAARPPSSSRPRPSPG